MGERPKAAAIYARISDDRAGERLGVTRQEELCRRLAEDKGWPVAEVYIDNDLSAYSGKPRPAYERMLSDLEAGTRDAVLTVDLDRLTRAPAELERFISLADVHGIALANVSGDTDLSSSDGRFRARIMGAVARQESEKKSERIRRQRDQAAQMGTPLGGPRPFGYEQDGVTIRDSEAEAVRDAVKRVLAGESLRSVAARWNAEGLPTARGGEWSTTTVRVVLTGPRVAGLRRHRGEVVGEAAWPAIISRSDHERLNSLAASRRGKRGRPASHLLTNIAVCGRCGAGMLTGYRGGGKRAYICKRSPGEHKGCGRMTISAEPIEELVRDQVLAAITGTALTAAQRPQQSADVDYTTLVGRVQELEERLVQLSRDHYGEKLLSRAEFFAARVAIHDRLDEARSELTKSASSSILEGMPTDPTQLREQWEAEGVEWQRTVLHALLDSIEVSPSTTNGARRFDPGRVRLVWRT